MLLKKPKFKLPKGQKSRSLNAAELDMLAAELDVLRAQTLTDLGEGDAKYIRKIVASVRYTAMAGRGLLFLGWFPPAWLAGTTLLGIAKILENMELAHNVMHGQYDWMNDPALQGKSYEWDTVGTSDNWRKTHNFKHHTYTNVKGMDDDVGYGLLRIFPEQRWHPFYLGQPLYAMTLAMLFQWGVAIQDLEIGKYLQGRMSKQEFMARWQPTRQKITRQLLKDYVFFPVIAGPSFLPVFLGNLAANGMRNLWTFSIIFCGHFTEDAEIFPKSVLENESRGHWYYRQIRGSSNLSGGKLLHLLSGNLSHQIEHHLFPDIPAHRYAELAPKVQEICERYGIHYNTGSFRKQFGQVLWRIVRHSLPSQPKMAQVVKAV
ncbi:fatty acid desaturase family protein [Alkanindiges illinoisensis]|uniref:fatty acid desaturase family protein n=1 Tax=Alkanindiges illinoisensis TaxID=197183 RepID=UPI00047D1B2E|nr:acyl-CoA desaturase [Alkanindiges illinoisensis]